MLVDEKLFDRSVELGDYFKGRLQRIESDRIKEVRGRGLFIGVELRPDLPASFADDMRSFDFRSPSLWDPPSEIPATIRGRAQEFAGRQVDAIRRSIFPVHGLVG